RGERLALERAAGHGDLAGRAGTHDRVRIPGQELVAVPLVVAAAGIGAATAAVLRGHAFHQVSTGGQGRLGGGQVGYGRDQDREPEAARGRRGGGARQHHGSEHGT